MPLHIILQSDVSATSLNITSLEKRAERLLRLLCLKRKDLSIVLMNDADMASFNKKYRNRKGPTNVLSFPARDNEAALPFVIPGNELGDILISVETAAREAEQAGKSRDERITELIIHGLLHLLGQDHERSEKEALSMWEQEQKLLNRLNQTGRNTMAHLAINVDHVATIREARGTSEPDPVLAAGICELAGASGIVVHLREDRRHIQDRDLQLLRQTVKTKLNLEMAAAKEMIAIALATKPDMITLVPEKRQELTTEGGLDVARNHKKIARAIEKMRKAGIPVSLFIDPEAKQIKAAGEVGATFVELHTGRYCDAATEDARDREFNLIAESAAAAAATGLRVNAGHGLDYRNTPRVAALETIEELSIGHAVISRAVFVGLDQAVREMLALIRPPFPER
ncbi:MAG: pyridoxine 5'-phosphate synthase [Desulfobulbaceae bacterium]|nr:pyridoxine 5'-phosphate synthase [Desulfobulbaceae bacterium]